MPLPSTARARRWAPLPVALAAALALPPAAASAAGRHVDAIVLGGRAESPLLHRLRAEMGPRLRIAPTSDADARGRRHRRRLVRHDVVIVDGDHISPRRLERSGGLDAVVRAGRWVLVIDARAAHLRKALAARTGFSSGRRRAAANLFRVTDPPTDDSRVRILEIPEPPRGAQRKAALTADARLIAKELLGSGPHAHTAALDDATLPPELQHRQYSYSTTALHPGRCHSNDKSQTLSHVTTFTYDIFLDNSVAHPQGSFQWISGSINGGVNSSSGYRCPPKDSEHPEFEQPWWTAWIDVGLEPVDDTHLTLTQNRPETANETSSYSSGSSFDIGFSAKADAKGPSAGVDASFSYSKSQSHTVKDWTVRSTTAQNNAEWLFRATSPCYADHNLNKDGCFSLSGTAWPSGFPVRPNELSLGRVPYRTSAVWRTDQVVDGPVTFDASVLPAWAYTWCEATLLWKSCLADSRLFELEDAKDFTEPGWRLRQTIDLGAVIPVDVKSLDFAVDDGVASAGSRVKGTLTLARPARTRVVIPLRSDDPHVQPPERVVMDQGQQTATFDVLTNANRMAPGEKLTATVTAFYAEPTRAQLSVVRAPAVASPAPAPAPVGDDRYVPARDGAAGATRGDLVDRAGALGDGGGDGRAADDRGAAGDRQDPAAG